MKATLTVHFPRGNGITPKGYIGNPYWPELFKVIEIQKQSGMNRARSSANRRKALEEYLKQQNLTLADYEKLQVLGARPFYTNEETDEIIIPEHQVSSFLVATCDTVRSNGRPCDKDQVRARFLFSPWTTGKSQGDGVYERFVRPQSGPGQKLSNQRSLRSDPYITDFMAAGTISFNPEFVNHKVLQSAIEFGGQFVGIGASRKMGWGRFVLKEWSMEE